MDMYRLTYKKSALKAIRKMPGPHAERLQKALKEIALDPYAYRGDWKPLKGEPFWRLRQGS
jgi:mRNA interferase RelE/StbE